MTTTDIFSPYIGTPEGEKLEYRGTLTPARTMAQIVAGFANTAGGVLIFGIRELPKQQLEIAGLSEDFNVMPIFFKAQRLLEPSPELQSGFFNYQEKRLFGIIIPKSDVTIQVEGKRYVRRHDQTVDADASTGQEKKVEIQSFAIFKQKLYIEAQNATSSKKRFLSNYDSILNLFEPMLPVLFSNDIQKKTGNAEGKALTRLLYSSSMDNFELYLSELLYEIYLANPNTLKAREATVRVEEVLRCSDIEEFIQRQAAKKASKLRKGSIREFLKENVEIKSLDAFVEDQIAEIEKSLQIRHLYTHRNGIVDDGFIEFFGDAYARNTEHQLSIEEALKKMQFIVEMVNLIDVKAANKFQLSLKEPA